MELCVRSQDKTSLSNVHDLIIRENRNENNEINYVIQDLYTLGIYKTKERALQVLDEIGNVIYLNKLFHADIDAFKLCLEEDMNMSEDEMNKLLRQISVYQMPEE